MEKRFSKIYFEITNVCNASCSFCPGTVREKRFVTFDEFRTVISKIEGRAEYLYFHLMGEPLLHREICRFSEYASEHGFKVMITTNGILAGDAGMKLIDTGSVFKISISLHCYESNHFFVPLEKYVEGCVSLADRAAEKGTIAVLRLWNGGGNNALNAEITEMLKKHYGVEWLKNRSGYKMKEKVFIEYGNRFDWPGRADKSEAPLFCHGLRSQIGILCDGTVVPCCLDSDGRIPLGNIFVSGFDEITDGERARRIYDGFTAHSAPEELCRTCGFARQFGVSD